MLIERFAREQPQQLRFLPKLADPGLFIVQGFENLRGNRVLLLFRKGLNALKSFLQQTGHTPKVA